MFIPETQQAWRVVRKGEPSKVLRLDKDVAVPKKLDKGEVVVKVQAAALNPIAYKLMNMAPNFIAKRPYIPEHDVAGIIVDANGTGFKEGDQVFGWTPLVFPFKAGTGVLAQYARIKAEDLVPLPANVTPVQASGVTLVAMTAYQALFGLGGLRPKQSVFVNGGSTAVGAFAIQLAKAVGCKVTASASAKNEEYVRSLGADEFVDYTKAPLHQTLISYPLAEKFHVLLEAVGLMDTSLYVHSEAYIAPGGIFISVGPQPKGFDVVGLAKLAWKMYLQPRFLGGTKRSWKVLQVRPKHADQEQIATYLAEGKIKPLVDSVYNFEDVLKAYERLMTGRATGKVVIKMDSDVADS
ncbi:uncharacterized protein C8Q71DRAFT_700158 [Rhodofomes roseus]|uniref:Enoyl reductase (ER) domain-containing protein n=1 Tax=Rhodofomes roseus TaxID=34475 RepID=A0ABQ8KT85_9APHY|nr:uncharacterized protein C8Q71DRAFT_700158 [Rhodofomes roseus]KAH9841922.1 hypothetical protein C8Q71DRAFT_700158 [Rhodofomes roseus]